MDMKKVLLCAAIVLAGAPAFAQADDAIGQGNVIGQSNVVSAATASAGTPEAGWWWNDAEGGRGFSIEIQNDTMFLAGYMYDGSGKATWYASGPTRMIDPLTYVGTWQEYGKGQTLTGVYAAAQVVGENLGTIAVKFASMTAGTLTLPDGRQIPISRYNFALPSPTPTPVPASDYPIVFNNIRMDSMAFSSNAVSCNGTLTYKNIGSSSISVLLKFDIMVNGVSIGQTPFATVGLSAGSTAQGTIPIFGNNAFPKCGSFTLQFNAAASRAY